MIFIWSVFLLPVRIMTMNIQWIKQPVYAWRCIWNLHLFIVFLFFFWKGKSLLILNLFILEYLDQIPPWKEMKEAFQSRSRLKIYLCLRLKLNKTQTTQIRKYNTISKHIHQNIRAYTRSKKSCINQWLGKYCILKKMWAKQGTDEQV